MIRTLPLNNMDLKKISSPFGIRIHPITGKKTMHNGIDYPCPVGTPVYAYGGGKVVVSKMQQGGVGLGNYITILHPDNTYSIYAHLNKRHVYQGNIIRAGQIIGLSGNTGDSTGPHLHFGICRKYNAANVNASIWFDPEPYLQNIMEDEVVKERKVLINGEAVKVMMAIQNEGTKDEVNYIKLRDLEKLGIKVSYNSTYKCPELKL